MRVSIHLSDELVKQIDERAKALFISRSAYIATALSMKLQSEKLSDNIPDFIKTMKEAMLLEKERMDKNLEKGE